MKETKVDNIVECKKLAKDIETKQYFKFALPVLNNKIKELQKIHEDKEDPLIDARKLAIKDVLSYLCDVMRQSQILIESEISRKKSSGEIKDEKQSIKSTAGNVFQQMVAYVLAINVVEGNITKPVIVTTSTKKIINDYATIKVGDDVQKLDSDVIIYSQDATKPIMNLSCKTSCRERAGQTYKWKLLSDIATSECTHKNSTAACPFKKYNLSYTPKRKVLCGFVTADFYDEIGQPQIEGIFNFFDYAYLAKDSKCYGKISRFNKIIEDIEKVF